MVFTGGGNTGTANPFGGGGIFPFNPGPPGGIGFGAGGFGSSSSKTGGPAPGFVSPFDQQAVFNALNLGSDAMAHRYAQLGLSAQGATPTSPGGPAGGIGANAPAGTMPQQAMEPTAEQMDLGQIPTLTGGLPGEALATLGEIQNANLSQSGGAGGGSGGGKGGGAGSAAGAIAPLGKALAGGK
jgi:hypothetical protein